MESAVMETVSGQFIAITRELIERMDRQELVSHLESRGIACFDEEPTTLLRDCALEDFDDEAVDQ